MIYHTLRNLCKERSGLFIPGILILLIACNDIHKTEDTEDVSDILSDSDLKSDINCNNPDIIAADESELSDKTDTIIADTNSDSTSEPPDTMEADISDNGHLEDTDDYSDSLSDFDLSDLSSQDSDYSDESSSSDSGTGDCPPDMTNIDNRFCIDIYEASLEELINGDWVKRSPYLTVGSAVVRAVPAKGVYPQAYISGKEAETACKNSGKRLCTLSEWLSACKGPYNWTYPYGNQYEKDFCNDTYISGHHPLCDYFKLNPCDPSKLNYQQFNDPGINQMPDTISKGGEFPLCSSYYGIYDMHGNLHEWIQDPNGTFKGGFYGDAKINGAGCNYTTTAHEFTYHDYSTGFRCCKDIR